MKKISTVMLSLGLTFIFTVTEASAEMYTVDQGDNLWNIAKEHDTSIDKIVKRNKLKSTIIHPDQELALYDKHEVVKGDTLYWIAKDYDMTVDDLMELNDLTSSLITVGQELKVNEASRSETVNKTETVVKSKTVNKETTIDESDQTSSDQANKEPAGKTVNVTATAYTAECDGCSGVTYTGVNLLDNRELKVIAVDPNVIPLGSKVYVEGYGHAVAEDIGGAIKGNKIDVHVPTKSEAYNWGVKKDVKVTIVE